MKFLNTSIMGVLNLTPDSFSDGGQFNNKIKSFKHISNMINSGANIIDVGGESTRPGSKTINPNVEWNRVKYVLKKFKKILSLLVYLLIQESLLLWRRVFSIKLT